MWHPIEVYYDGWCPVCAAIRVRLERLDWLGLLRFASLRNPGVDQLLALPPEELTRRMHVRHPATGRIESGIDAVAAVAVRVPALMVLWPLIKLSSLIGLGGWLYDWIASRRAIIPTGGCDEHGCHLGGRERNGRGTR